MSLKVDLKSQDVRRGISFDFAWVFVVIAVLIAFLAYYAWGIKLSSVIESRQSELKDWQQKVAAFAGIQGRLDQIKAEINAIQAQITNLRELRYDPLRYSILLVRLSKLLPTNMWIASMSIEPSSGKLTLTGSAAARAGHPPLASIAEFIRNLQNDKDNYFSDVSLQSTSGEKGGGTWTFNLTANYSVPLIQTKPPVAVQKTIPAVPTAGSVNAPPPSAAPSPSASSSPGETPSSTAPQGGQKQ